MTKTTDAGLLAEPDLIDRIFHHIDQKTTDLGEREWQEPVEHYHSQVRFEQEIQLLRRHPVVFFNKRMHS